MNGTITLGEFWKQTKNLVLVDPANIDVDQITLHVRDEEPGDAHPDDFELTRQDVLAVLDFLGLGAP